MIWWKFWKKVSKKLGEQYSEPVKREVAIVEIVWSQRPGCFERHLQRKYKNPFFPRESRAVTQADVDRAREKDKNDRRDFRLRMAHVLNEITKAPGQVDVKEALWHRQAVDDLLRRAAEIGGDFSKEESDLAHLYQALIDALRGGLNNDKATILEWVEGIRGDGITKFNNQFIAQQGRQDSPIKPEELVPAMLSEPPEAIRLTMSIMDDGTRELIRRQAIHCIADALIEGGGVVPMTAEWLQAIGLEQEDALGLGSSSNNGPRQTPKV